MLTICKMVVVPFVECNENTNPAGQGFLLHVKYSAKSKFKWMQAITLMHAARCCICATAL